jgi:hypothetical protein
MSTGNSFASTSDCHKTDSQNSDFVFLPPKDPPAGQPNVEGLIPITMAVAVSSFELLKDAHGLPLFQGYPTGR